MMTHNFDPSSCEAEEGRSLLVYLQNEFWDSQGHKEKLYLEKKKTNKNKINKNKWSLQKEDLFLWRPSTQWSSQRLRHRAGE